MNGRQTRWWPLAIVAAWLALLSALALTGLLPVWPPIVSAVASVLTWIAYAMDKARAGTGARRIPERILHLLALPGGWPGGLLGQQFLRHKTRKVRFQILFWLIVLANVAAVAAWWYLAAPRSA